MWDNGAATGFSAGCDSSPDGCAGGVGGWTVFDDFISFAGSIRGFTYSDVFLSGGPADYVTTNWSIWISNCNRAGCFPTDPLNPLHGPNASGSAVAVLTPGPSGTWEFAVDVDLVIAEDNRVWLGIQNVMMNSAITARSTAAGNGLPGYKQADDPRTQAFNRSGDTAFTIVGVPEPETWLALTAGLLLLFGASFKARSASQGQPDSP